MQEKSEEADEEAGEKGCRVGRPVTCESQDHTRSGIRNEIPDLVFYCQNILQELPPAGPAGQKIFWK